MSHYPSTPSYTGPANYTPQWPAYPPHPSNDLPDSAISGINTSWGAKNFAPMPFNANPPTQLPGLGLANGFGPSPYLPRNHPNSQIPVPFGAHVNGTSVYPQDASLSTSPSMPPQSLKALQPLTSHPASGSHERAHAHTQIDTDREEGEVSDFSGNDAASQNAQHSVRSKLSSRPHANEPSLPHPSNYRNIPSTDPSTVPRAHSYEPTSMSVLDNGQLQREGSESPYNPPMTITAIPEASEEIASMQDKTHLQQSSSVKAHVETSPIAGKTVSQARVMAQGALLGLAPHNIRFNDLVKENINPDILRQLYNEIGIKVVPDVKSSEKSNVTEPDAIHKEINDRARGQEISTAATNQVSDQRTIPQQKDENPSATSSSKPLERKELIARMLAAKANKATTNPGSKSADSTPQSASSIDNSTVLPENTMTSPKASSATQPKAKNKAQTELARQRMEQLLKKRQQSQPAKPPALKAPATDNSQQPATLSHPLPERPPVPNQQNAVSNVQASHISGPSSNVSESKSTSIKADTESSEIDLSTPGKAAVKRPRATDFDDAVSKSAKPSVSQDRLVIDISDDESMADDDEARPPNTDNVTPSSQMSNFPRSNGPSYQRSSASATPQSRLNDPESLRRKQLEIEAMRRRIAEYEEKQKAKKQTAVASGSTSSGSVPSISGQDDATQSHAEEPLASATTTLANSVSAVASLSPSARLSTSTDASKSDQLRQKLRRKQEIESGLPTLDSELERIEAKLAGFRRLEEELMAEIAKGREGRKQLMEELQTLVLETQAIEASGESQDVPVTEDNSTLQDGASSDNTAIIPDPTIKTIESQPSHQTQPIKRDSPCVSSSSEAGDDDVMVESDSSSSEGSSSSMSESTSDSERGSIAPEPEPEQQVLQSRPDNDHAPSQQGPAKESSVTERLVSQDSSSVAESSEEAKASDGPTAALDFEKPSEVKDSEDEAYSPKLDASDNDEMDTDSASSSSSHDADMKLTPKFQEQVVIASKNDALDNGTSRGTTTTKFSPYESPLKYFRGYRYHPNFVKEVGDGYRSLTYSHKINPSQAVCPYESAGGVCNDNTCEFQHWRDMVMPDDKILVEMGNQREGDTPEEKERFLEGLKETINTMQRDEVKDFSTVASEIAAYRRRFLSDPSRILPL